jgi:hypothetical protein
MSENSGVVEYAAVFYADLRALLRYVWSKRLVVAVFLLAFGAAGFWRGCTAPAFYETYSLVSLKPDAPRNSAYSMGLMKDKALRLDHFRQLLITRDVLETAIRQSTLQADLMPGLRFDAAHPPSMEIMLAHIADKQIRTRMVRNPDGPLAVGLWVRAGDSTLARDLSLRLIRAAEIELRKKVREEAMQTAQLLGRQLAATKDPETRVLLEDRISLELDKAVMVGGVAAEFWQLPTVPEHRVAPKRKMLLGLSLLLGTIFAILFLVLRNASVRTRFFGNRTPIGNASARKVDPFPLYLHPIAVAVLFGLLYGFSFKMFPSFTSSRMAFLILLIPAIRRKLVWVFEDIHENLGFYLIFFGVFAYSIVLNMLGGDTDAASLISQFIYLPLLGSHLYLRFIGYDWDRFHRHVMWVVLIQSCLQFYSFISIDFRFWVSGILFQTGNVELTNASAPPGFSSGAGAAFAIIQSLGAIAALILLRKSRSLPETLLCTLALGLSIASCTISGRTGLLISLAFLIAFAWSGSARIRIAILTILIGLSLLFFVYFDEIRLLVALISPDLDWRLNGILRRAMEPFTKLGDAQSVQEYSSMIVPALKMETFLGTGFLRSVFDGRHDSGYVQMYYGIGLPMALLYYGSMLGFAVRRMARFRAVRSGLIWVVPAVLAFAFLIEAKEHLITKAFGFYAFALLRLGFPSVAVGTDPDPEPDQSEQSA